MKLTLSLALMLATSMYAGTVNLSLATNPSQWSTLTSNLEITQRGLDQLDSLNWTQAITTAGPVRSGFLQIQTGGMGSSLAGAFGSLLTGFPGGPVSMVDPQYGSPATVEIEAHCSSNLGCSPGNGYYGHYNLIPIALGTAMTLESVGSISYDPREYIWDDPTVYGGHLNGVFQFRFYEADGTTPVGVEMVSDAPEPSSYGLVGVALAGAGLLRKKLA